jgi:uncharacterized protein DUF3105
MAKRKTSNSAQTSSPASRPILPIIAVVVFVCAAAAYMLFGRGGSQSGAAAPSGAASSTASASGSTPTPVPFYGTFYPSQGHAHLDPGTPDDFKYNSNPPTSGPHREMFTDSFLSPVPLPSYVQVHLLEHGNVLLQYSCKCDDVAAALGAIAMDYNGRLVPPDHLQPTAEDVQGAEEQGEAVIVAPYPSMHQKIALTAWTRVASLANVDHAKINSFINSYLSNRTNASQ